MVKLFRAELTATGRPVLLSGEVERGMLDKVRAATAAASAPAACVHPPLLGTQPRSPPCRWT